MTSLPGSMLTEPPGEEKVGPLKGIAPLNNWLLANTGVPEFLSVEKKVIHCQLEASFSCTTRLHLGPSSAYISNNQIHPQPLSG